MLTFSVYCMGWRRIHQTVTGNKIKNNIYRRLSKWQTRYCVVQRNKLTCWRYANGNDIKKKKCDVFAILDILARHGKVGQKKLMNKQTLHILHVYFSQLWELSSIIYSLLLLFCILFIVSTQIAASRRKKSKKRRLDIVARHSNLVTVAERKTRF